MSNIYYWCVCPVFFHSDKNAVDSRKTSQAEKDARNINVYGTQRILRFCCTEKLKYLYHASTYIAANAVDDDNFLSEDWPKINEFDFMVNTSYPISKFLSEVLIHTAVERGVPCKVFRLPSMGVDSLTGNNINVFLNNLILRCLGYMSLGCVPAAAVPISILPVDVCAELSVSLFFNDSTKYEVYNLLNPNANDEQELDDISRDFGYPVEIVEPDEMIKKVEEMPDSNISQIAKSLITRKEDQKLAEDHIPEIGRAWLIKKDIFKSKKIEEIIPGYYQNMKPSLCYLKADLEYAKQCGLFAHAGLK